LRFDSDLAVGAEDVDGGGDVLVDILDEFRDGFLEDGTFFWCERVEVWFG